eukprot:COSAG02_NODE_1389_length_12913_cov_414.638889_12_plen_206_part_00
MVLSFDLSLRGAGVSSLLIVFVMNLIVTPQLLESWEQGMLRDSFRRQLRSGRGGGGQKDLGEPWQCVQTVCGGFTWDDAVQTCAQVGAEVCQEAQFNKLTESVAGEDQAACIGDTFVQSAACPTDERMVITNSSSSCVSATTQVNRVACCAVQACMEGVGRDDDCCTAGDGACMDGCTFVCSHLAKPRLPGWIGSDCCQAGKDRS